MNKNGKDLDVVMPVHDAIEHSYNFSKTSRSLLQYYKAEPDDKTNAPSTMNAKIVVPLR